MRQWQVWRTASEDPAVQVLAHTAEIAAERFLARCPGEGEITVRAGVLGRIYHAGPDGLRWVCSVTATNKGG